MISTDFIARFVEQNIQTLAPVAALFGAWLSYGVLGRAFLGPDADAWPVARRYLVAALDSVAARTPGLYVRAEATQDEYAGYTIVDLDDLPDGDGPLDPWERKIATLYDRNLLAAYKHNERGWQSDGSWARRYGRMKNTGEFLKAIHSNTGRLMTTVTWLPDALGRFISALGDVLALRQVHVTVFLEDRGERGMARIHQYPHDEPNALNPFTALAHYRGKTQDKQKGIRKYLEDTDRLNISIQRPGGKQ